MTKPWDTHPVGDSARANFEKAQLRHDRTAAELAQQLARSVRLQARSSHVPTEALNTAVWRVFVTFGEMVGPDGGIAVEERGGEPVVISVDSLMHELRLAFGNEMTLPREAALDSDTAPGGGPATGHSAGRTLG